MKKLFTLIELIVVIVVIGILSAIVIPNISNFKQEGMNTAIVSNIKNIQTSVDLYSLKNNGELPVMEVTEFVPKPIDFKILTPNQLRNTPKTKGVLYWIDAWGTVWGSTIDAPKITSRKEGKLVWNKVDGASEYRVYELEGYNGIENIITGSLIKTSLNKIDEIPHNDNMSSYESVKVEQGKAYLVSAVDNQGFETAPVSEQYEGHMNVEEDDNLIVKEKPLVEVVPSGWTAIYTVEDLNNIRNNPSGKYILMNSLDLEVSPYNEGLGWNPIPSFAGQFDGNGLSISNLYINRPTTDYTGLFGTISGGSTKISNLQLKNVDIIGQSKVGAIAGQNNSYANIINSSVVGGTILGSYDLGGLVGVNNQKAKIHRSFASNLTVSSNGLQENIGGLVGYNVNQGEVNNSYADVKVSGVKSVGGLVGYNPFSSVNNSYSIGEVKYIYAGTNQYVGGIIGYNYGYSINYSYYNKETTISINNNLTGNTTSQMYQKSTYMNWDFESIWIIDEGNDYPKLRWETK